MDPTLSVGASCSLLEGAGGGRRSGAREHKVPGTAPASVVAAEFGAMAPLDPALPEEGTELPDAAAPRTVLNDSSAPQLLLAEHCHCIHERADHHLLARASQDIMLHVET